MASSRRGVVLSIYSAKKIGCASTTAADWVFLLRFGWRPDQRDRGTQHVALLPSLDVVAVSQAPSPESNPNSPLPVIATVGQYPTVGADRSET